MDSKKLHAEFSKIVEEMQDLVQSKGDDYEDSHVKFTDYYFCSRDLWLQVNRKALRLRSLISSPPGVEVQREPNYESIDQNAIDLAAYAIFLAAWLRLEERAEDAKE